MQIVTDFWLIVLFGLYYKNLYWSELWLLLLVFKCFLELFLCCTYWCLFTIVAQMVLNAILNLINVLLTILNICIYDWISTMCVCTIYRYECMIMICIFVWFEGTLLSITCMFCAVWKLLNASERCWIVYLNCHSL